MRNLSMLKDTVELFLYIGEFDDEAQFQRVTLRNCYCVSIKGANSTTRGKTPADSLKFYVFDCKTEALSEYGKQLRYMPYDEWEQSLNKSEIWTLSDRGVDFFRVAENDNKYKIVSFSRKKTGRKRMWHFEVVGR